jgi:hypothetical protein
VHDAEIKGAVYFVTAKKIRKGIKKCFGWPEGLFEIDVFPNDSSTTIYNAICAELDKFRSDGRYKKWHLHTEAFRNIGPFVDWRRLVNLYQGTGGSQNPAVIVPEVDT